MRGLKPSSVLLNGFDRSFALRRFRSRSAAWCKAPVYRSNGYAAERSSKPGPEGRCNLALHARAPACRKALDAVARGSGLMRQDAPMRQRPGGPGQRVGAHASRRFDAAAPLTPWPEGRGSCVKTPNRPDPLATASRALRHAGALACNARLQRPSGPGFDDRSAAKQFDRYTGALHQAADRHRKRRSGNDLSKPLSSTLDGFNPRMPQSP